MLSRSTRLSFVLVHPSLFHVWVVRWLLNSAKGLKGVPGLQFKVRGYVERCARARTAPRGRAVLQMISCHFDLGRVRGSLITSRPIFQLELHGYPTSDLQDFSAQVMKVLNGIPHDQWPNQRMLGEFLFHKLRTVRCLERVIDEIKRSPGESPLCDFAFLWSMLHEFLVEEREDANARSIEQSLKSPKKSVNVAKAKTPAVPAKAAPAAPTNVSAAAAPSKAVPKKTDVKSTSRGKSKGHGKPLGAEERAKTSCIFHQMPSGCVHGAEWSYSHSKAPPAKPKSEGNADPKPKSKAAPAAAAETLATVAILAGTMLQPSQAGLIEWAADSGAGRHLTSFGALSDQGHGMTVPSLMVSLTNLRKACVFRLLVDKRTLPFPFILGSCRMVRSVRLDVEQNGLGFVRLPGCKPYYVRNPAECHVSCSEENKFYAPRVC